MSPPFEPPPYPQHRLSGLRALAELLPGGLVDCSVGTPCDPPLGAVLEALATSGAERGYPESAGGNPFRTAAARWLSRRFEVEIDPDNVAACIGTKELVASSAQLLRLRRPERDCVLFPEVSYPTYAMGAVLGGCRPVSVPPLDYDGTGLDLSKVDAEDVGSALLLWVNSPSNPTGGLSDLGAAASWGRANEVPVLSDECYAEFTWDGPPCSILQHGPEGVLAVHSLSKRSNLAGVRAGFYAGDPELVSYLRDLRRHAGLMVPGPVQAAAAVALDDDSHVETQRRLYSERLEYLAEVFDSVGCPVDLPAGGFYLWISVPRRWSDAWAMAEDLAKVGGLLVSPGDLYGPAGAGFVRVAVVQPMERLRLVGERLDRAWGARGVNPQGGNQGGR